MQALFVIALSALMAFGVAGCGSGYSAIQLPVTQPPPPAGSGVVITALSPASVSAGSADTTLSISGKNLDLKHAGAERTNTVVCWCDPSGIGPALSNTIVSSTLITATVPASLLVTPATVKIGVQKWYFADDTPFAASNYVDFTVNKATAAEQAIVPSAETLGPLGSRQFQFLLNGSSGAANWEIQEGAAGGQISATGWYTAPDHTGTFHIVATAAENAGDRATAMVMVTAAGFTTTGKMHVARSGHTATLLNDGRVLIVGGDELGRAEVYDPASGSFAPTGNLTATRLGATATLLANGRVLIAGGFSTQTEPVNGMLVRLNSAELYDPVSGTFTATGSMNEPRVWHTATLLEDGRVLIAGGTDSNVGGGAATASGEVYDPQQGTFSPAGLMNSARAKHSATLLSGGEVLVVGGFDGAISDAADDPPWDPLFAELFSPVNDTFRTSASMSTTRIGHKAMRLKNGNVLVFGGIPEPQDIHRQLLPAYAETYDFTVEIFSRIPNWYLAGSGSSATTLKSGLILIAGGAEAGVVVASCSVFDPDYSTLGATGGLVNARRGHTATLLRDGRVLVTGGTGADGNDLATAEIYQ